MERQKKVVDASVIVKLFANEQDSEIAVDLRNKHINGELTLIVPELIFAETLNALRYKKLDEDLLDKANKDLWDFQLNIIYLDNFLLNKSIKNAKKYNLTIYDAIYISVANLHGCPLITADEKLAVADNAVLLKTI